MPETKYTKPVCRGSWALGSACGKCERCAETRPASLAATEVAAPISPLRTDPAVPAWKRISDLLAAHRLFSPPIGLRDELVNHLAWAEYGWSFYRSDAQPEPPAPPLDRRDALLREAAALFREYEGHHRAKITEAGRPEKAERNRDIAERIEAELARQEHGG